MMETPVEQAKSAARGRLNEDLRRASPGVAEVLVLVREHLFEPWFASRDLRGFVEDRNAWKRFQTEIGEQPDGYLATTRLVAALQLIARTDWPMTEICRKVGLALESSDFSRLCRRRYGLTPTELRTKLQPLAKKQGARRLPEIERDRIRARLAEEIALLLVADPEPAAALLRDGGLLFPGRLLFDRLVVESRKAAQHDHLRGVAAAQLPLAFVEGLAKRPGFMAHDWYAAAWAWLGNSQRLAGNFRAAGESFRKADRALRDGVPTPETRGLVIWLKGTFRLFERKYEEARRLLDEAISLACEIGDRELEINARLQRSSLSGYEGAVPKMLPDLEAVRDLVTEKNRLLQVSQNLAWVHIQTGDIENAALELATARHLADRLDHSSSRRQLTWIAGLLARAEARLRDAEVNFRQARAAFVEAQDTYSAAMATLDLALLLHDESRVEEIVPLLVADVLPVLETLDLGREALAAYRLLEDAVAENAAVSRQALERARRALFRPSLPSSASRGSPADPASGPRPIKFRHGE